MTNTTTIFRLQKGKADLRCRERTREDIHYIQKEKLLTHSPIAIEQATKKSKQPSKTDKKMNYIRRKGKANLPYTEEMEIQ